MPMILENLPPSDPLLSALSDFLLMMDATLPANQNVQFYLSGGMVVYLYTGCQRTFTLKANSTAKCLFPTACRWCTEMKTIKSA